MNRIGHLIKGLSALGLLAALVLGIPWALWHFIGWPLPHHLPSVGQLGHALNQQGIPDQTLIDALAVVVWVTWAVLVASVAVEVPAALAGRHARHLPLAGIFQPVTGRLVAAVIVAVLTLAPRPAHGATPGSLGGGLSTASGRQPVAAMLVKDTVLTDTVLTDTVLRDTVLRDTVLTAALQPLPATATSTAPNEAALPGVAASANAASSSGTYVVQRGDTLWGIAERQLGDPLRWSEIYQLNHGRPQPDGRTLADPHWIDPGWSLVLPTALTPPVTAPTPLPATTTPTSPSTSPSPATTPPTTPSAEIHPVTSVPAARVPPVRVPAPAGGTVPRRTDPANTPVRLPSGSTVAGSFAAGVLSAVALGRLRRRHAYRYRPPEPGRDLTPEPLRPTLRHLAHPSDHPFDHDADHEDTNDPEAIPFTTFDDPERRQHPGRLDLGTHNDATVTVEVTDLSGIALCGPATDDIARALVAGLLVRAGPGAAEVLLTTTLADRLFPGLAGDRAIRRAKTTDDLARAVESEMIARSRRFDATGAADAAQFRAENPENPLPLLLVLLDTLPAESLGRWAALVADAARLGIAVVFLAPSPIATGQLCVDPGRRVFDAAPADRLGGLLGAQLFGLRADEATEVLAAVTEAAREGDLDEDPFATNATVIRLRAGDPSTGDPPTDNPSEPWREPSPSLSPNGSGGWQVERPIAVRMFGHFEVAVFGEPVVTGLRSRARDVFAWCLLRPEGATSDEAVDALWPDTAPGRVHGQFWRSFSDLRTRLREAGGGDLEVFTKVGEHYRPCGTEIACDLWEFQAALGEAARTDDDEIARTALRRAVEAYRGDLLAGMDRPWVEPVRQDLHRRALDAHLRLAELENQTGRPDAAVEVLEQAITRDRYAEEPYRRLMALHAAHGRSGAVSEVWRLLQGRLAELDLDVETLTADLYHQLTADQQPRPGPDRVRLPR